MHLPQKFAPGGNISPILALRLNRIVKFPPAAGQRLRDLPFGSVPGCLVQSYSFRKSKSMTLLVDFQTVKGEFAPILEIRPYWLGLLLYRVSISISPSDFKSVPILGRFPLRLLLLLRSANALCGKYRPISYGTFAQFVMRNSLKMLRGRGVFAILRISR